jgi:hypothetical protein
MTTKFSLTDPAGCLIQAQADVITKSPNVALCAMFIQEWDTPALGFLGVAAAQTVHAYTIVFTELDPSSSKSYVYFDGRYAYTVHNPNMQFGQDVENQCVGSMLYASDYEFQEESEPQDAPN